MNNRLEQVLAAADEIEKLFDSSNPAEDRRALNLVNSLCVRMKGVDPYISEKAEHILTLASDYFSARKHQKYDGGAEQVRSDITVGLLGRIRDQVEYLQTQSNKP